MQKYLCSLLVIIAMMASVNAFAGQSTVLIVPANLDSTGTCIDLVVAYGHKIEPVNNQWVFTSDGETTYLNGQAFDPVEKLVKCDFTYTPSAPEKLAELGTQIDVIKAASQENKRNGIEAAADVFRNSDLVEEVEFVTDNCIGVVWKGDGFEEVIFQNTRQTTETLQAREPVPTHVEQFVNALERGDGFIFGTDLRASIPKIHKESFQASLEKMQQRENLSAQEKMYLPVGHKGFRHDVLGN